MRVKKAIYSANELAQSRSFSLSLSEPLGYVDGADRYEFVKDDPDDYVDPSGLDATTQPGSVRVRVLPAEGIMAEYTGNDRPVFKQTVHIVLPDGAGKSDEECSHHGGKDPTKGPVGDNGSGDPDKPAGTDKNGKATRDPLKPQLGGYNDNGSTDDSGKVFTDGAGPIYKDNNGKTWRVKKEFVLTVCDSKGNVVRTVKWQMNEQGTSSRQK